MLTIRVFFIPKVCKIVDYFKALALLKPNLRLALLLRKNKSFGSHYNAVTSIHFYGFGKCKMILNGPVFLIFDDLQNEASHDSIKF